MRILALAVLVAAAASSPARAETFQVDPNHSSIAFKIRHLMGRVPGKFTRFEGRFEGNPDDPKSWRASGTVDAASIDTGNEKRDADLRSANFFDVEKCPKITFKSTGVTNAEGNRAKLRGDLTMHCVTKPVTLDLELGGVGQDPWGNRRAGVSATGKLDRKDWGIVWNKALDQGGMMLGDEVELSIDVEAIAQPPAAK